MAELFRILGSPLRYFAKQGPRVLGGWIKTPAAWDRLLHNLSSWDLYVTLNPTRPSPRLKAAAEDVTEIRWLLADFDPDTSDVPPFVPPAWLDHIAHVLVHTGRGYQAWLSVRSHPPDQRWQRAASAYLSHLPGVPGFHLDTACADAGRVCRAVGSRNSRTGKTARIESIRGGCPLEPQEVLGFWTPPPPKPPPLMHFRTIADVLPLLEPACADYLTQGVRHPHRHRIGFGTARALAALAIPLDKAIEWMLNANSLNKPRPLEPTDIVRLTKNAYRKEAGCLESSPQGPPSAVPAT